MVAWTTVHVALVACWGANPYGLAASLLLIGAVLLDVVAFAAVLPLFTRGQEPFDEEFFRGGSRSSRRREQR